MTERQRDRETERQRDRETERQRDRETERQRDRETERQINNWLPFLTGAGATFDLTFFDNSKVIDFDD